MVTMVTMPKWVFTTVSKAIWNFLWGGKNRIGLMWYLSSHFETRGSVCHQQIMGPQTPSGSPCWGCHLQKKKMLVCFTSYWMGSSLSCRIRWLPYLMIIGLKYVRRFVWLMNQIVIFIFFCKRSYDITENGCIF